MYAMLCGYLPFEDKNTKKLYQKIIAGKYHIPSFIRADARDLIQKILNTNPDERYTIEQIRAHPWYKNGGTRNDKRGVITGYHEIPVDEFVLK